MMVHYKFMRKTKQGLRSNRMSHQEQLCKLVLALPNRKLPQERIESEFDDRVISKTPHAQLNSRIFINTQGQTSDQLQQQLRRERIKTKIKSQVRQKIKQLSREWSVKQPTPEFSISGRSHIKSVHTPKRNIFISEMFQSSRLNNILGKCVAEQIQLRHKEVFKQTKYRSRLLSTSQRNHLSSIHSISPNPMKGKMSTPHLQLREPRGDQLEPWRYNQDPHIEYTHLRQL